MTDSTYIDPEEKAYPHGGFARRGKAILRENKFIKLDLPYGEVVSFRASIADTYFSIPARFTHEGVTYKAFLTYTDGPDRVIHITPERGQEGVNHG